MVSCRYDRPQHSATHLVWTEESAQNRSSVIVQREQLEIGVRQVTCDYDYDEEDNDCDDYMRRIMKTHFAKHHGQNDSSTQISSNCLPLAPWVPHLVVLKIKMIICFPSSHIVTCYSRGEVSLTLFLIIFSTIDPSFAHFLINSAKVRPIFQCLAYLISIWKDDDALLMVFVPLQMMMPCWLWWWLDL